MNDDIRRMSASTRKDPFKGQKEMAGVFRFGRRIALPSTRQIKHDMRMLMAADGVKALEQELADLNKTETAVVAPAPKPAP